MQSIGEGLWAYIQGDGSWWLNNTGLISGPDSALVIDTCATESRSRAFARAVHATTPAPVKWVVNTHGHSDHVHGNGFFEGAVVVAQENARAEIVRRGIAGSPAHFAPFDVGELTSTPPEFTFRDAVAIWVDGLKCDVSHTGRPAHTSGDSFVWLADASVLFAGDLLFNGVTPLMMGGSVTGLVEVLEQLLEPLGAQTVVPGHGAVGGPEIVVQTKRYANFVLTVAEKARRRGQTALQAARDADLGEFTDWKDPERLVANLHRAFADLDGLPQGQRCDYEAMMRDMRALRGGGLIETLV